ncbi:GntR family transcriptional regulator [Tatumella sp. UBA2305]|uniref:GntR family transcriptional regulator n=1 Tax=Tatumella sp. UBA2305 TaxID=1947647 RepID=UPI0025EF280A|nr:GntR family transcriptional regulator [Tatumella sp. UBA2305]
MAKNLNIPLCNENSSHPMYEQVYEYLYSKIINGEYEQNQKIPSESQLMEIFGVSRITIRQGLSKLQSAGMIYKSHGRGAFVSPPVVSQDLQNSLQGFSTSMRKMGHESHSRLLSFRNIKASDSISKNLRVEPGSDVIEIKRLRFLNKEPVSIDVTYILQELGERLRNIDFETQDIFHALEEKLYISLGYADLKISSQLANSECGSLLNIEEGSPVLMIERIVNTASGKPIEYENLYYRGDSFQFNFRVNNIVE